MPCAFGVGLSLAAGYNGRVANVKIFQKIIFKISQIWQKSNKIIFANFR